MPKYCFIISEWETEEVAVLENITETFCPSVVMSAMKCSSTSCTVTVVMPLKHILQHSILAPITLLRNAGTFKEVEFRVFLLSPSWGGTMPRRQCCGQ